MTKAYVITITKHPGSVRAANRLIKSSGGNMGGIIPEVFKAITPEDDVDKLFDWHHLSDKKFHDKYSKPKNAMACFLSHFMLWKHCVSTKEEIIIFEHDAVIMDMMRIHDIDYNGCISFGKPSYGKYKTPASLGVNKLISKEYFPGAHAYMIKPERAKELIEMAQKNASPTDLFLRNSNFDFLEEYYPWPVEVVESFSTVQKKEGCLAKHKYNENYEVDTTWDNITGGDTF